MSRAISGLVGFVGIVGAGYALMAFTTPTEQELYNRMSPDLRKKVDDARMTREGQAQKQAQLDYLRRVAQSDKPIWQDQSNLTPEQRRQI